MAGISNRAFRDVVRAHGAQAVYGEMISARALAYGNKRTWELMDIEKEAERVLQANGFSYGARVDLKKEKFPTRVYGEYTLPAGEYAALIVRLGRGNGDNWWCVVYPPLCFAGEAGQNIIYKSKIQEIIQNWKNS